MRAVSDLLRLPLMEELLRHALRRRCCSFLVAAHRFLHGPLDPLLGLLLWRATDSWPVMHIRFNLSWVYISRFPSLHPLLVVC